MQQESANQLLDRLYALTDQVDQWPALVQSLLEVLNTPVAEGEAPGDAVVPVLQERRLLEWLTPHVLRVLNMQRREHSNRERHDFFEEVLEHNAVALALCDGLGTVRWACRRLRPILQSVPSARVQEIIRSPQDRPSLHTVQTEAGSKVLMLVEVPALGPHFCALVLQGESPVQLDSAQLDQRYGLTPAEAAIANLLAQGLSPEDIARTNGTALTTVRSQLKKVLAKLGVSRQAEAVSTLLSGSAALHLGGTPKASSEERVHAFFSYKGLRLAYVVQGPSDGYPVFFLHSWGGSRLQAPRDTAPLFTHGFKLIAFDRPGMGASTGPKDYAPELLAQALQALALQMGHPRFSLLAYSLGAHFAMQYALALGDVVEQLFLVSPTAPLRGLRDLRGTLPSGQLVIGLSMKAPKLADPLVRLWMAHMRRSPSLYLDSVMPYLAAQDRRVMATDAAREEYMASFVVALSQGDEGLLTELRAMASDWTHHTRVHQTAHIWHGQEDSHVPLSHAQRLCDEMPHCSLTTIAQAGHFLLFHQWHAIVADMAAARMPSRVPITL